MNISEPSSLESKTRSGMFVAADTVNFENNLRIYEQERSIFRTTMTYAFSLNISWTFTPSGSTIDWLELAAKRKSPFWVVYVTSILT